MSTAKRQDIFPSGYMCNCGQGFGSPEERAIHFLTCKENKPDEKLYDGNYHCGYCNKPFRISEQADFLHHQATCQEGKPDLDKIAKSNARGMGLIEKKPMKHQLAKDYPGERRQDPRGDCIFRNSNDNCTCPEMYKNSGDLKPEKGVYIVCSKSFTACRYKQDPELKEKIAEILRAYANELLRMIKTGIVPTTDKVDSLEYAKKILSRIEADLINAKSEERQKVTIPEEIRAARFLHRMMRAGAPTAWCLNWYDETDGVREEFIYQARQLLRLLAKRICPNKGKGKLS